MEKRIITVGGKTSEITGRTHQAIQAAIDYIAGVGGGNVCLDAGQYEINSPLHMRSNVHLAGVPRQTILFKNNERTSPLLADADQHERQVTVLHPSYFEIGQTVTIRKANESMGFQDTVATIVGKEGDTLFLDSAMSATVSVADQGIVTTNCSVISAYNCTNISLRGLVIEGNRQHNSLANGCRNAGIFLMESHGVDIDDCLVRHYNGDGISYQCCSDVIVSRCESSFNGGKGVHPGSGTKRTVIRNCSFEGNDADGIFFCWRVQDSTVEHNRSIGNRMSGFSIGHKDIRNSIRHNTFSRNGYYGVFFRNEPDPMAANYNRIEQNTIEDNGSESMGFVGVRIRGHTHDVVLRDNRITFSSECHRTIGICMEPHTRNIDWTDNTFDGCALPMHTHWLVEK